MAMFAQNVTSVFTQEEQNTLRRLGAIAERHLEENDKRVVNAIAEALEILEKVLKNDASVEARAAAVKQFENDFRFSAEEAYEEFVVACFNTAQYDRGLEICAMMRAYDLVSEEDDVRADEAEFYGHLGEIAKAEAILFAMLGKDPQNIWNYIRLGDLYYFWQLLPEKQDLPRAEHWYYKAFDMELGAGTDDGIELCERLGDVCVERLCRSAEEKLFALFERLRIGGRQTFEALKDNVYLRGLESVIFQHIQGMLMQKAGDTERANEYLDILTNAYNLMPQRDLGDWSPFQMTECYTPGEHTARIMSEKFAAYQRKIEAGRITPFAGAEGAEAFSKFQYDFMQEIDAVTGWRRDKVVADEQKQIKKSIRKGTFVWMGFVKFRNIREISGIRHGRV